MSAPLPRSVLLSIIAFLSLLGQSVSSERSSRFSFIFLSIWLESARLCAYDRDPSQYYPCALNHIGLNSWSLYQCPSKSTFDESSQQCLVKLPISDTFGQLVDSPTSNDVQFQRVAQFFLSKPTGVHQEPVRENPWNKVRDRFEKGIEGETPICTSEWNRTTACSGPKDSRWWSSMTHPNPWRRKRVISRPIIRILNLSVKVRVIDVFFDRCSTLFHRRGIDLQEDLLFYQLGSISYCSREIRTGTHWSISVYTYHLCIRIHQ